MRLNERLFGRKTADAAAKSVERLNGLGSAHLMQNLGYMNRQQRIQQALGTRQMCKILGMPDLNLDDEMIAGGDIIVNRSKNGPWIFASMLLLCALVLLLAGVGLGWRVGLPRQPGPPSVSQEKANQPYIDVEVIPGNQ